MKTSGLQFRFLLIVAGFLGLAMAVSVYSLFRVFGSIEDLDRISREDFDSQQSILMATVHFQRQAQEFNQVLLRGDDPAALDRSWGAFEASEKAATEEARLARSSSPHKEVRDAVEVFLAQHKTAGETYRRGLEAFKAARADPRASRRGSSCRRWARSGSRGRRAAPGRSSRPATTRRGWLSRARSLTPCRSRPPRAWPSRRAIRGSVSDLTAGGGAAGGPSVSPAGGLRRVPRRPPRATTPT